MANIPATTTAQSWTITQKSGDRKQLKLSGWGAPFGRPRQGSVVRTPIQVRQKTYYYPGNNVPTRHIFGLKWDNFDLHGRFMDYYGGTGFAKQQVQFINEFVSDQVECYIEWGRILSFTGLIEKFDPGYESEGTVDWKMSVLISKDNYLPEPSQQRPAPLQKTAADYTNLIVNQFALIGKKGNLTMPPSMPGNLLDALGSVVNVVNSAVAQFVGYASAVENFEQATFNELARLRAGIGQLKTALLSLRDMNASLQSDAILLSRDSLEMISLQNTQATADITMITTMSQLEQMDRAALQAQRGTVSRTYVALTGDTWESISITMYGSLSGVNAIRQANGVKYGINPIAGAVYQIPGNQTKSS
jgi:hypothetical protein